jgi:H+/Cl- antiporter ClcA
LAKKPTKPRKIAPTPDDHTWKVAVAGIGVVGATIAAYTAGAADVLNNLISAVFHLKLSPLEHESFWQVLVLVLVVGGLTIGMIHAMKQPTR